jgi:hypothetical protein
MRGDGDEDDEGDFEDAGQGDDADEHGTYFEVINCVVVVAVVVLCVCAWHGIYSGLAATAVACSEVRLLRARF